MKRGDLAILGNGHRLMCGDAGDPDDVATLFDGRVPDLVFTSPPYLQQRAYSQAIPCWDTLMQRVFGAMPHHQKTQVLVNLGLVHRKGEWLPYWDGWIGWMRDNRWKRLGWYVWDRMAGLPTLPSHGRLYPSHEFIFHFNKVCILPNKTTANKSAGKKTYTVGMMRPNGIRASRPLKGPLVVAATRIADSVIRVSSRAGGTVGHPAVFPVALPATIQAMYSHPGGLVYDPFAGAGTSILAADQGDRVCYGMEISPEYCDAAVERWHRVQEKARAVAPKRRFRKVVPVPAVQGVLW